MENPIKMDDLGVPLFSETSIYSLGISFLLKNILPKFNMQPKNWCFPSSEISYSRVLFSGFHVNFPGFFVRSSGPVSDMFFVKGHPFPSCRERC